MAAALTVDNSRAQRSWSRGCFPARTEAGVQLPSHSIVAGRSALHVHRNSVLRWTGDPGQPTQRVHHDNVQGCTGDRVQPLFRCSPQPRAPRTAGHPGFLRTPVRCRDGTTGLHCTSAPQRRTWSNSNRGPSPAERMERLLRPHRVTLDPLAVALDDLGQRILRCTRFRFPGPSSEGPRTSGTTSVRLSTGYSDPVRPAGYGQYPGAMEVRPNSRTHSTVRPRSAVGWGTAWPSLCPASRRRSYTAARARLWRR